MWVKTVDGNYYNMLTGSTLSVQKGAAGDYRIYVMNAGGNTPLACLQNGFRTREDAQDALDDVLSTQDMVTIDVPEYDDEEDDDSTEDSDESEEDDDIIYEDNYAELTNSQLRTECSNRTLSTEGNKRVLIDRLREDDVRRLNADETV